LKALGRIAAGTAIIMIFLAASTSQAQSLPPAARQAVYRGVLTSLNSYIFPDVGEKMKVEMKRRRATYLAIDNPDVLARTMTDDLREVSHDKHINVMAHSELPTEAPSAQSREADAIRSASTAYGFYDVRHLPGNIGYVDLHSFTDGPETEAYAISAMTLVSHSNALIIDVRKNHGGLPAVAELLTGYLTGKMELIARVRTRHPDGSFEIEDRYSVVPKSIQSYQNPVYILTSKATFSAAEYFTYCVQSAGRGRVVGEVTGGGGNSGDVFPLAAGFSIFIPTGSIESAVTHRGWEGAGVQPNISTTADAALTEAYKLALLATKAQTHSEQERKAIDAVLADPDGALKSSAQL
jgi:C-terminal processing protease CtpA/Prc